MRLLPLLMLFACTPKEAIKLSAPEDTDAASDDSPADDSPVEAADDSASDDSVADDSATEETDGPTDTGEEPPAPLPLSSRCIDATDTQGFCARGVYAEDSSGVRYEWEGGLPNSIPEITPKQLEDLWAGLVEKFGAGEDLRARGGMVRYTRPAGPNASIDDVTKFLLANDWVKGLAQDGSLNITCPFEASRLKTNLSLDVFLSSNFAAMGSTSRG